MHNTIKQLILIMFFFLATIAQALTCDTNDSECKAKQSQLRAFEKAGIKPTEPVEIPETKKPDAEEDVPQQTVGSKPFKIPLPASSQQNQDTTTQKSSEEKQAPPKINIFTTNNNNEPQTQNTPEFVFQPPESPFQFPKQTTGIQYH